MARAPTRHSKVPPLRGLRDSRPVQLLLYGLRVVAPLLLVFAGWLLLCALLYGCVYTWYDPETLLPVPGPGARILWNEFILPAAVIGTGGTLLAFAPVTVRSLRRSRDDALRAWYRIFPIDGRLPSRVERVHVTLAEAEYGTYDGRRQLRVEVHFTATGFRGVQLDLLCRLRGLDGSMIQSDAQEWQGDAGEWLARDRSFGLRGESNEVRLRVAVPLEDPALARLLESRGANVEVLLALRQVVFVERDLAVRSRGR